MTRPAVLDMDLVVVPREPTNKMLGPANFGYSPDKFSTIWDAMLYASPYPTAWDDVRKYVEGLERERDDKDACLREVIRHAMNEGNTYREDEFGAPYVVNTRAEAAEARIAELEKRLADAERVLSPFIKHYESWMDRWPDDEESSTFSRHTFGQLRAARAYMEGK